MDTAIRMIQGCLPRREGLSFMYFVVSDRFPFAYRRRQTLTNLFLHHLLSIRSTLCLESIERAVFRYREILEVTTESICSSSMKNEGYLMDCGMTKGACGIGSFGAHDTPGNSLVWDQAETEPLMYTMRFDLRAVVI